MVKVTTLREEIACVFCGRTCSIEGRRECAHFVSVSRYFGDAEGKEIRYVFRFQENKEA